LNIYFISPAAGTDPPPIWLAHVTYRPLIEVDSLKISSVVPIFKVHSPTEKSDYRPISILPVLAKVFENVMYEQMVNYVATLFFSVY
jgi:hypothetical protein